VDGIAIAGRMIDMAIKYVEVTIAVHGLQIEEPALLDLLKGRLHASTKAILTGDQKDNFKFRDDFASDIEVNITETAGKI